MIDDARIKARATLSDRARAFSVAATRLEKEDE